LAAAVVRELFEETGQDGLCEGLMGWTERFDEGRHLVILDFSVTVPGATVPLAGDDAADAAWVPLSEVRELVLVDGLDDFLTTHGVLAEVRTLRL